MGGGLQNCHFGAYVLYGWPQSIVIIKRLNQEIYINDILVRPEACKMFIPLVHDNLPFT